MKRFIFVLMAVALVLGTSAVNAANNGAERASATLRNASGQEIGFASFTEDATGNVQVNVHVAELSEGLHGIHLHAVGNCVAPSFASAGGHFNPTGSQHGLEHPDGAHAGDLPNMVVNAAGQGRLNTTTDRATLSDGSTSLFDGDGTAVVIHAGPDDQVTSPAGNSGARIACGVIERD